MNTKLVAYFFLVAVVAAVYADLQNLTNEYIRVVQKYCTGRYSGPNSETFLSCYEEQLTQNPQSYNADKLMQACIRPSVSDSAIKVKCDIVNGGASAERDAFMQCLVDKISSLIQGTGTTFEQVIADKTKKISNCA